MSCLSSPRCRLAVLLVLFVSVTVNGPALAGKLYSQLEHQHFGELWTHSVMTYRTEKANHHRRVEAINTMPIADGRKQQLLDMEYARHDGVAENFRRTRAMIQGAVINETNARLGQNIDGAVTPSLGKRPGDAGYRGDEADLDAQGSELAVKRLKEVMRDMGLDTAIDIDSRDTAGVLELGENFELTINKSGVAATPGSEFHQIQNAVDARHPETFLSQKLLHKKQAGRRYIEIQDHLKKAGKGHVLSGEQLIANPNNLEKARVMYKSTRKALDTDAVDPGTLAKILKQNNVQMTPAEFKAHLADIETSKSGRLISKLRDPLKVEQIRRASEDIFAAAEKRTYTVAQQQKAELGARIEELPANSPKRRALEAELQDTRVKMRESAAANREFRRARGNPLDGVFDGAPPNAGRTELELERAVSGQGAVNTTVDADLPAAAFKVYNDINDVAQGVQVVEDYIEGRASLGKAVLTVSASIADSTLTLGAAGVAVQTGEKLYDHQAAKSDLDAANKRNMEAYLTRFAIEFRRAGMSKEDALRYVDNAARDGNVNRLKDKIAQLRAQGHPVRIPQRPQMSIVVASDDTVAQRADQVLLGGGGAKLSDLWDAWDKTDYANRRNMEAHLAEWEVNLRRAGMDQKAAKQLIAQSLLGNDFSPLRRAANALRADGKKIDIPRLHVETITQDDDVLQRMREFGLTRHTIMAPSRMVDAYVEGGKVEAELDYRNASITAQTRTALFRRLKRAGIDSKRALLALNNWEEGEFGLLKKVLEEAHANIEQQRLEDAEIAEAEAHAKAAIAAMQAEKETLTTILGLVRDLQQIKFTIESDPYPIPAGEGENSTRATIVVTSNHDPEMILKQIAANIIERYGSAPNTRVRYLMHFAGKTVSNDGIWELSLPAVPGVYPLDARIEIEVENPLPALRPLNRLIVHELAVDLEVVPGEKKKPTPEEQTGRVRHDADETEMKKPGLAATVPGNWKEVRIEPQAIVIKRSPSKAPSARKDCGRTDANGRMKILLNPGSAPDSKAAIDAEMSEYLAAGKKENKPVTLSKTELAGFSGSIVRTAKRYISGSASFSGFRSGNAYTHAHGYLINASRDVLKVGYTVGASGCYDNSDRSWIEAQVDAITREAEGIIASVRYLPGGGVTFSEYTPPANTLKPDQAEPAGDKSDNQTREPDNKKSVAEKRSEADSNETRRKAKPDEAIAGEDLQPPYVRASKHRYVLGEDQKARVRFAFVEPRKGDYVALYKEDASDRQYLAYQYTKAAPSGELSFALPEQPGRYQFRLMHTGYKRVVADEPFEIQDGVKQLSAEKWQFLEGEVTEFNIDFTVPVAKKKDWIAVYESGADRKAYRHYVYTGGNRQGRVTLPLPKGAGSYELRYYRTGYRHVFTEPRRLQITPAPRRLETDRNTYAAGADIQVQWQLPYPKKKDWIAIFEQGHASRSGYTSYKYTDAKQSGRLTLQAPEKPGVYELRYYPSGGGKRQISSATFTVR